MWLMADVLAAAVIAALAGMGIGGGGLLVLYLVIIKGMGQTEAQGLNLVFFICAATASLWWHGRKGRVDWRRIFTMGAIGTVGAVLGALAATSVSSETVRKAFGWMMIISGGVVLLGGRKNKK